MKIIGKSLATIILALIFILILIVNDGLSMILSNNLEKLHESIENIK